MGWKECWHEVIVPLLPLKGLEALEKGLVANDPRLIQGQTTKPSIVLDGATGSEGLEGGCVTTYCGWFANALTTVAEGCYYFAGLEMALRLQWDSIGMMVDFLKWYDNTPRDQMIQDLLPEVRIAINRKKNVGKNPCSEIVLESPQPVMPWVQVDLMNQILISQGKPGFTLEQRAQIQKELEDVAEQTGRDRPVACICGEPEARVLPALDVLGNSCGS